MDWTSADGTVTAELYRDSDGALLIAIWQSHDKKNGNTVRALQELRQQYPLIRAICTEGSEAYWENMRLRGLVDEFSP